MVRLATVLDSWKSMRQDTAQAVEDMPASELDFKPVPELDSFRGIALHILNASYGLTGLLLEGWDDFSRPEFRGEMRKRFPQLAPDAPAAALAASLRSCLDERLAAAAAMPAGFWDKMIKRFDGQQVTTLEMLEVFKDHELTHRSQLFVYLRLKGIVPVTTRRKQARQ